MASLQNVYPAYMCGLSCRRQSDRLRRMMGVEDDGAPKQSHMSADDLNDGFILDKEDRKTLTYQVNQRSRFSY